MALTILIKRMRMKFYLVVLFRSSWKMFPTSNSIFLASDVSWQAIMKWRCSVW